MSTASRLLKDNRANAITEFALIAPLMLLLLFGLMEFSHVSSARTRLEGSTMRAARAVAASDCPSEREALMKQIVTDGMSNIPSPSKGVVQVTTKSYSDKFGDVGEPEPFSDENGDSVWTLGEPFTDVNGNGEYDDDMGTAGSIGGAGQVISYTARYQVSSLFGFISSKYSGSDIYTIEASTVIRNEPIFNSTGCT